MKKRFVNFLLLSLACMLIACATACGEGQTGVVCVENAMLYADEALTQPIADVPYQAQVSYEDAAWEPVVTARYADADGYMPRTSIGIPREGEWQGYETGAVLCQSLSLRRLPDHASERIGGMGAGERFTILAERDGFYLACRLAESEDYYETGWIKKEYDAKNKGTLTTTAVVHARAYGDETAPLVGEISAGTRLNCIARVDEYYVVSLRGASAFIRTDAAIELDGEARNAMGAP